MPALHPSFDRTGCTSATKLTGTSAFVPVTTTGTFTDWSASDTPMSPVPSVAGRTSPVAETLKCGPGARYFAIRVTSAVVPPSRWAVTSSWA